MPQISKFKTSVNLIKAQQEEWVANRKIMAKTKMSKQNINYIFTKKFVIQAIFNYNLFCIIKMTKLMIK